MIAGYRGSAGLSSALGTGVTDTTNVAVGNGDSAAILVEDFAGTLGAEGVSTASVGRTTDRSG